MRTVVAVAALAAMVGVVGCSSTATAPPATTASRPAAEPSAPQSGGQPTPAAASALRPVEDLLGPYEVADVVDGDTVKVVTSEGVVGIRLIGIDTPETVHPTKPVECYGPEASAEATRLLAGQRVWVELDSSQGTTDRYGRTLAYIWLDETTMVNYELVLGGFASEYTYDGRYNHQESFRDAERRAVAADRGLWGACAPGEGG